MKILVIDKDALTSQLVTSRLGAKGHVVIAEPNKNTAFDILQSGTVDCVLVDPAPLSEARPVIAGIWRHVPSGKRPYILLLSKTLTTEEAILQGANDVLAKPVSSQELEEKTCNAQRFLDITRHLAKEDEAHSGHGLIGKAAFNQLYLSSLERAFRYGERTDMIFMSVLNYGDMLKNVAKEAADDMMARLEDQMQFMRRQSDVIGRLSDHSFAILLQRPMAETEPLDVLHRFAEALDGFYHGYTNKSMAPQMDLHLVEVPQGTEYAVMTVPISDAEASATLSELADILTGQN